MSSNAVVVTLQPEDDSSCSDYETGSEVSVTTEKLEANCPSSPLLSRNDSPSKEAAQVTTIIPCSPSMQSFRLSDAVSMVSAEEITQRREALRLFSSQLSMASTLRSNLVIPGSTAAHPPQAAPPIGVSYDLTPFSSTLSALSPFCRICQSPGDPNNILINPCRCNGSLKFIHGTCLRKWIEVCERKHKYTGPAFCELCGYIYRKHKFFKLSNWQWPRIATKDKILHTIFMISLVLMIGCAVATVMCFTTDRSQLSKIREEPSTNRTLSSEEEITIVCGITFFVSFFVSISVELKSRHAIHEIIRRCIRLNTMWLIENYSRAHDSEAEQQEKLPK